MAHRNRWQNRTKGPASHEISRIYFYGLSRRTRVASFSVSLVSSRTECYSRLTSHRLLVCVHLHRDLLLDPIGRSFRRCFRAALISKWPADRSSNGIGCESCIAGRWRALVPTWPLTREKRPNQQHSATPLLSPELPMIAVRTFLYVLILSSLAAARAEDSVGP